LDLQSLVSRLKALLWFDWAYDPTVDAASLAGVAGLGAYALVRGLIRVDVPSILPIGGLVVIYLLVPDGWFGTAYLPDRLPMVIFLVAVAATDIVPTRTWERASLLLIVVVLVVARAVAVERAWQSADAAFQPLIASLHTIPEGSRVYSAVAYERDFRRMRRTPFAVLDCYATIYRHAFCPEAKAGNPSQWIIDRQPPYDVAPGQLRNYRADDPRGSPNVDPYDPARLEFYDYLVVINVALWPRSPPPSLQPVLATADYTLFRIEHPDQPLR
jgi:hypothetical protein